MTETENPLPKCPGCNKPSIHPEGYLCDDCSGDTEEFEESDS